MTDGEVSMEISQRIRDIRLLSNLTQSDVAAKSLVPLGTYKAFERHGRISLLQLISVAGVLGYKDDFLRLFQPPPAQSLDELSRPGRMRQRARR